MPHKYQFASEAFMDTVVRTVLNIPNRRYIPKPIMFHHNLAEEDTEARGADVITSFSM